MVQMNEKYKARRQEEKKAKELVQQQKALNGMGTLTFHTAQRKWRNSDDFKNLRVQPRMFEAQHEIIRMLEKYLTEEERKTKYLYEIEDKLLCFFKNEFTKDNIHLYSRAFLNFILYVNKFQNECGQENILTTLRHKIIKICGSNSATSEEAWRELHDNI